MQFGDSKPMEEESLVPKYWRDYLENDHLPIYNIDLETLKKRDKVILKDVNTLDESDMKLLSNKERVDLAKFKVDEIRKQMKEQEIAEKSELINSDDLLVSINTVNEFNSLHDTKKSKYINDLCSSIIKTPKTDLDKIEILIGISDNRILEDTI
jgi:hypothetical protein